MSTPIYIPERFQRVIQLHILKNMMVRPPARESLFLGIHGPSGDGKTFQCEQVLEEMGVQAFLLSGGQLEDHYAGEPAKLLRLTYLNAHRYVEKGGGKMAAIVMNDVDTGVGKWEGLVQYTVNRQNVFGELMHLADYPYSVQGVQTSRIPIIMTGNDFTKLYEPLVRAGRMTAFVFGCIPALMLAGIFWSLAVIFAQEKPLPTIMAFLVTLLLSLIGLVLLVRSIDEVVSMIKIYLLDPTQEGSQKLLMLAIWGIVLSGFFLICISVCLSNPGTLGIEHVLLFVAELLPVGYYSWRMFRKYQ